ncbi:MAG TPA: DUF6766 family protein [Dongiaceae bacterium]|jgi:hypothetical protein|nr:DUF6766 family protein [Dongiaceae bacterium]
MAEAGKAGLGTASEREGVRFLRDNGLSLTVFACFAVFFVGQALAGWLSSGEEIVRHGGGPQPFLAYLASGHFIEATAENLESEFLQMAAYVFLTVWLRQRGSAESKSLAEEEVDRDPRLDCAKPDAPWPVRRGGWPLRLYENSLSLAFFALFAASFMWHVYGGLLLENQERRLHGEPTIGWSNELSSADFWFESLQNWQSEFFAVGCLVVLSIWLRQRGSPESKPVSAPHGRTGK